MQHFGKTLLVASLLWLQPFLGFAQTTAPVLRAADASAEQDIVACPVIGMSAMQGPATLSGTQLYHLDPDPTNYSFQDGQVSWSVSPASSVIIRGSSTANTLLLEAAPGCGQVTATVSAIVPVSFCGTIRPVTVQKTVVVDGPAAAAPHVVLNGPTNLSNIQIYYLTPGAGTTAAQLGAVTWSATPASAFTIYGSTTGSTLLVGPGTSCNSATGTISATVSVTTSCGAQPVSVQQAVTTSGGASTTPVVQGTYYCTTCANQSVHTLSLEGSPNNTGNNVAYYGTYRIDLTSASSQDVFLAWNWSEPAGATLRIVSGTNNRSGLIDLTPGANLAALAANVTNGCVSVNKQFRFSALNATYRAATPTGETTFLAGPNPATDEISLVQLLSTPNSTTLNSLAFSTATLVNMQGVTVRTLKPGRTAVIDVRSLPAGPYSLKIVTPTTTQCKRILVAH